MQSKCQSVVCGQLGCYVTTIFLLALVATQLLLGGVVSFTHQLPTEEGRMHILPPPPHPALASYSSLSDHNDLSCPTLLKEA